LGGGRPKSEQNMGLGNAVLTSGGVKRNVDVKHKNLKGKEMKEQRIWYLSSHGVWPAGGREGREVLDQRRGPTGNKESTNHPQSTGNFWEGAEMGGGGAGV